jgi:hypothetical protein
MIPAPAGLFDPEFSREFTRFGSAFSGFSRQASLVLGSVHPSDSTRSRLSTSALRIADSSLIAEWVDFQQRFARICEDELKPHFRQIDAAFHTLFAALHRICHGRAADRIQALLCDLKDQIAAIRTRNPRHRFDDFDGCQFHERLRDTIRIVTAAMNAGTARLSEKEEVIAAGAEVAALVVAAERFDSASGALARSAEQLNRELAEVHVRLKLRFNVQLTCLRGASRNV